METKYLDFSEKVHLLYVSIFIFLTILSVEADILHFEWFSSLFLEGIVKAAELHVCLNLCYLIGAFFIIIQLWKSLLISENVKVNKVPLHVVLPHIFLCQCPHISFFYYYSI